ncbi:type II toxin-antitoxin system RelE/ParE family toxin [Bradyrhizobium iriomotense]|uniref:Uncharacterized protein n=1 Tax=Bradyrhizobium iriomotense TaxID=441950 RepID=A0ABQ6B6E9_9BRAD|nr:type II toxin-antitoxin system RelE/ParE family toxin [Bradyrhizobium iriomotense]GLR89638.1 hypothetical protein GCM10007857_63520 [Bradyrhizobium iriomotense]
MIEKTSAIACLGSSKKGPPAAVRSKIRQSLFEAQHGEHPRNAKPLKGFSGCLEIRDNFDGDTYRTVDPMCLGSVLNALYGFQKNPPAAFPRRNDTST